MTAVITRHHRVRPFVATDLADVVAMYDRCSPDSTYRRWHGQVREFPALFANALLRGRLALVARRAGTVVGLADAGVPAPGTYEIAILVEDAWQRRGVGTELLAGLVSEARARGAHTLRADVLSEDRGLLAPLHRIGPMATTFSTGVITCEVLLRA